MPSKSKRLVDLVHVRPPLVLNDMPAVAKAAVVARDGGRCRLCQRRRQLHVHHIDRQGALSHEPNHDPSNLITLCRRCHRLVHAEGITLTPDLLVAANQRRIGGRVNLPRVQRFPEYGIWPETAAILNDPSSNDGEPIHGGWMFR